VGSAGVDWDLLQVSMLLTVSRYLARAASTDDLMDFCNSVLPARRGRRDENPMLGS